MAQNTGSAIKVSSQIQPNASLISSEQHLCPFRISSPFLYPLHQDTFAKKNLLGIMAPHSSTLAWKIPWTEEPGRLQSMGLLESDMTERLHFHFSLSCIGEGNGNPLQCSCLENPRDRGASWAAISGVTQSRTRLKRLSSSSSILFAKTKH